MGTRHGHAGRRSRAPSDDQTAYRARMVFQLPARVSLYEVLAVRPSQHAAAGETATTRQKETIDHDAEALQLELDDAPRGLLAL